LYKIINISNIKYEPIPEPKHNIAYKVQPGTITIDGELNEQACEEVDWTDIEGDVKPKPRFSTSTRVNEI
jgi:hypothetical protein